jgi:Na+/H+-dicarboxylate symporter
VKFLSAKFYMGDFLVAVLMAANIPITALPILFGVDRIFDMLRTAVNITGDAACATIVDSLRDEKA